MLRTCFRSSRPKVFLKIDVHKNFAKFRGKHLRGSFFFINVTDLRLVILLEKRLQHKCFPVSFTKCLRTFFYKTSPMAASNVFNVFTAA